MSTDPAEYEQCIVTFIDILGFRSMLATRTAQTILEAMLALRKATSPDPIFSLPGKVNARLADEPFSEAISDAVVRARPYETEASIGALLWELNDLQLAQVDLASRGIFVRGAMTIGSVHVGDDGSGPFFGTGLVEAYNLESAVARHPRIIVHEEVIKEHRKSPAMRGDQNTLEFELKALEGLLRRDSDGYLFVHYPNCRSCFDDEHEYRAFLEQHARSIESGYNNANNDAVRSKFLWLRNYHNQSVVDLCRIQVDLATQDISGSIDISDLASSDQTLIALHRGP